MAKAKQVARHLGIAALYAAAGFALQYAGGVLAVNNWLTFMLLGVAWLLTSAYVLYRNFMADVVPDLGKGALLDRVATVSPLIVWNIDGGGRLTSVVGRPRDNENLPLSDMVGLPLEGFKPLSADFYSLLQRAQTGEQFDDVCFIRNRCYRHYFFPVDDGQAGDDNGQGAFQCISMDVTAVNQLRARAELSQQILAGATEAIVVLDRRHRVTSVNRAFTQITEVSSERVVGKRRGFGVLGTPDFGFYRTVLKGLKESGSWQGEVPLRRSSGELFTANFVISVIRDRSGSVSNYVIFFSDITHMQRTHEELRYLANHDNLTDLPNRRLFLDRLEQGIKRAKRGNAQLAIFFIDLDNFKLINDAHGHYVGDEILKEVGRRLLSVVRQSDTVARLAGDEFTVITENIEDAQEVTSIARKIMGCFEESFAVSDERLEMSASVGIGVYPDDGEDLMSLLKGADTAMYKAKAEGRNGFYSLSEGKTGHLPRAMFFPSELRLALKRQQMELVYQPLHDLRNGRVVGCEGLLRWNHHLRGIISPADFMTLSEGAGITSAIGKWTLNEACQQLQAWRVQHVDLQYVSINIASSQINDPGYPELVMDALATHRLHPSSLMLEIAEGVLLQNLTKACQFMRHLSHVGVKFCVDEYGSSHADYSYIREVPVDALKIDQRLLARIRTGKEDSALIRALVGIGDILGKNVIAVGVERRGQEELMQELGCQWGQGFLYAKPMTAATFSKTYARPTINPYLSRS